MYYFAKVNQLEYSPWLYLFTCAANEIMENSSVNTSKFGMPESRLFAKIITIIIIIKLKAKPQINPDHMGRICDFTDFIGPSISLLYTSSLPVSRKIFSLFSLIQNLKQSLSFFKQKLSCVFQWITARLKVKTSKGVTGKYPLGVIRAAWSLISK